MLIMKVNEALQFKADLGRDLAAEQDPALRGWYEQETRLTPEFKESELAAEKLGDFATGLQALIDARQAEPTEVDIAPDDSEVADLGNFVEEEYVSPEERKKRSVLSWLDTVVDDYRADVAEAKQIPKASKRDKRLKIADNSFRRKFEYFGADKSHIVYDVDALQVVVEELTETKPELLETLTNSVESYIANRTDEFYDRPDLLAKLFGLGMTQVDDVDKPIESVYSRAFSALGKETITGTDLVEFRYAMARTALELVALNKDSHSLESIVSVADFLPRNEDDRKGKAALLEMENIDAYRRNDMAKVIKIIETGAVISQIRIQLLGLQQRTAPMGVNLTNKDLEVVMHRYLNENPVAESEEEAVTRRTERMHDYSEAPLHFDLFELTNADGQSLDTNRKQLEADLQEVRLQEPLFRRRMEVLAPVAYTREISRWVLEGSAHYFDVVHTAVSPNLAVSTYVGCASKEAPDYVNTIHDSVYNAMLREGIGAEIPVLYDQETTKLGFRLMEFKGIPIEGKDETLYHDAVVVLRPLTEADKRAEHPVHQLTLPLVRFFNEQSEGAAHELITRSESIKKNILENGTRFVGRRPIAFKMPAELKTHGISSLDLRRHEDGKRTLAQFTLADGTVELEYDQDLEILDNREIPLHGDSYRYDSQAAAASAILLPLLEEWACREVAETSEGSVSLAETGRVNMGHFAYLGFKKDGGKKKFRPDQAAICQREQGRNLAVESLRRQAMDPTGQGRNSTYVRENYDPSKPALEVRYDPAILGLEA